MKKLVYISFAFVLLICFSSCKNEVKPEVKTVSTEAGTKTLNPNATYAKVEFSVDGMTCAMGCAKTIEKKIAKMEGVKTAKVDFDKRLAMVEYDEAKVTPKSLEATVTKAGKVYKVKGMKKVDTFSFEKK